MSLGKHLHCKCCSYWLTCQSGCYPLPRKGETTTTPPPSLGSCNTQLLFLSLLLVLGTVPPLLATNTVTLSADLFYTCPQAFLVFYSSPSLKQCLSASLSHFWPHSALSSPHQHALQGCDCTFPCCSHLAPALTKGICTAVTAVSCHCTYSLCST